MKKIILKTLASCFILTICLKFVSGQTPETGVQKYDQHKVFSPLFYGNNVNVYRSASGAPGPKYWQNRADYKIDVSLDTSTHRIEGYTLITYTNNSPEKLPFLWLQLDQNVFREDSRHALTNTEISRSFTVLEFTKGDEIKSVNILRNGKKEKADWIVNDTRMQIKLADSLPSSGGKLQIQIDYAFKVPLTEGDTRMGRNNTKNGWIYAVAQWYPRMEVFDDISGWNVIPYTGDAEFYLEYGDFDFTIHAPADMIVAGSGELQNPSEVMTPKAIGRLTEAKNSDKTVFIKDSVDLHDPSFYPKKSKLSWHFVCKNARDISWGASRSFLWDASRINLISGKKALAQSMYPVESAGNSAWGRSTEYVKAAIELYSAKWFGYTYPVATNIASAVGGMEYPGIIFCDFSDQNRSLWEVVNHEFGHNWFPMIVGSNERKFPWMDEGFNTFMNPINSRDFNKGEYFHEEDQQKNIAPIMKNMQESIMTTQNVVQGDNSDWTAYFKPALGLNILRDQILGRERFDYAFKTYIERWAFKHPTPWDFFQTMNNAGGEDLNWFWNEWFFTIWSLDQAVKEIKYVDGDPRKGVLISIENLEGLALPVTILIKQQNGKSDTVKLPAEVWQRGSVWTFSYNSTSKLDYVVIDPQHELPDINSENNILVEGKIPKGMTADKVIASYLDAVGGMDKLQSVRDLSVKYEYETGFGVIYKNFQYKAPNKIFQSINMPVNKVNFSNVTIKDDQFRISSYGRNIPVNDTLRRSGLFWFNPFVELEFNKAGHSVQLDTMMHLVNNAMAYQITVTLPDEVKMFYYYDQKTGLKTKQHWDFNGTRNIEFSDYREIGQGIKIPYLQKTNLNGRPIEYSVKSAELNSGLSDDPFK